MSAIETAEADITRVTAVLKEFRERLGGHIAMARRIIALEDELARERATSTSALIEQARLRALLGAPETADWMKGVELEAAHQQERWGSEHDAGKAPSDWFWLLGYLAGKALAAAIAGNVEKLKHHTISSGAVLLNWHRHAGGQTTAMRPGIAPPETAA
jgi:hypothetical protein